MKIGSPKSIGWTVRHFTRSKDWPILGLSENLARPPTRHLSQVVDAGRQPTLGGVLSELKVQPRTLCNLLGFQQQTNSIRFL